MACPPQSYIYIYIYLLMKHVPSLESNTTYCELVGNAGPAPIRVPSLHFLYILFLRLYNVLSLALLLLQFIENYWIYIYIYTYIYIHIYICMFIHIYTHTHTNIQIYRERVLAHRGNCSLQLPILHTSARTRRHTHASGQWGRQEWYCIT